jgi:hypothetical protein
MRRAIANAIARTVKSPSRPKKPFPKLSGKVSPRLVEKALAMVQRFQAEQQRERARPTRDGRVSQRTVRYQRKAGEIVGRSESEERAPVPSAKDDRSRSSSKKDGELARELTKNLNQSPRRR